MTLDGFLTFLALIIAGYGIAPGVMQMRLRLHMVNLGAVSIVGFALVCWLEMGSAVRLPCLNGWGDWCQVWRWSDTQLDPPKNWSFAVVMVWLVLAWAIFINKRLWPSDTPNLSRLVDELITEQKFAELVKVMEVHLPFVIKIATQTTTSTASKNREAACQILRALLITPRVVNFISEYRSRFAVRLLDSGVEEVSDFSDSLLEDLISDNASPLYHEIKYNQNLAGGQNYDFPADNPLLFYLFGDARNANRLSVWRPVGEWAIKNLRRDVNPEYVRSLNAPPEGFSEGECWKDPTYITLRFFDLMVTAAEYQGVAWHMWLYYFPHFATSFVSIYDASGPAIDEDLEIPTRLAVLVVELFDILKRWIEAVKTLPADSPHRHLDNEGTGHQNDNIPKSAMIAMSACLRTVLSADRVRNPLKVVIFTGIMRMITRLPRDGELAPFRRALVRILIDGTSSTGGVGVYRIQLRELFDELDIFLREELPDVNEAIGPRDRLAPGRRPRGQA